MELSAKRRQRPDGRELLSADLFAEVFKVQILVLALRMNDGRLPGRLREPDEDEKRHDEL